MSHIRSRCWSWTLNNYTDEEVNKIQGVKARYICFGKEKARTGTHHLQGYVYFDEAKSMRTVKDLLVSRIHVEKSIANAESNRNYCKKDGDFWEKGDPPQIKKKAKLNSKSDISECNSLQQRKYLDMLRHDDIGQRKVKPNVSWYYGPTQCGKSYTAFNFNKESTYPKNETKWWDSYYGQDTVVIDDFEPNSYWTFRFILKLCDEYPLQVEYKGGTCNFNSPNIFFTSEKHPFEILGLTTENEKKQLTRRIKIKNFSKQYIGCHTDVNTENEFINVNQ